jgi:hypothetical protein
VGRFHKATELKSFQVAAGTASLCCGRGGGSAVTAPAPGAGRAAGAVRQRSLFRLRLPPPATRKFEFNLNVLRVALHAAAGTDLTLHVPTGRGSATVATWSGNCQCHGPVHGPSQAFTPFRLDCQCRGGRRASAGASGEIMIRRSGAGG